MDLAESPTPSEARKWPSRESQDRSQKASQAASESPMNVGEAERAVSVAAGSILGVLGLARRDLTGLFLAGVGGAMIHRGMTGHCHLYEAMNINTADDQNEDEMGGIRVVESMLIGNSSPQELYGFWRDFENLPKVLKRVKAVRHLDPRRTHWVVAAPNVIGGEIAWDAEITEDEPDSKLAWRSIDNPLIEHHGSIRFAPAPGDRGTRVRVELNYRPLGGVAAKGLAKIFGETPDRQIREDLRNFKRMMEVGEILTLEGQSRGSCSWK